MLCDDGKLYVMKMHPNPQGPNVLANKALGAILLSGLGLTVPLWRPLTINLQTLPLFPELAMEARDKITFPACGVHFGSEFLGGSEVNLFDFIPKATSARSRTPNSSLRSVSLICGRIIKINGSASIDGRKRPAFTRRSFLTTAICLVGQAG